MIITMLNDVDVEKMCGAQMRLKQIDMDWTIKHMAYVEKMCGAQMRLKHVNYVPGRCATVEKMCGAQMRLKPL